MDKIQNLYHAFLEKRESEALKRSLLPVIHAPFNHIEVAGQDYINVSSNDYLGLSHHPALIERAQDYMARYGAGSGASRLVTGNIEPFETLEEKMAEFKGTEAALIMVSGYQANASVLPALFDKAILGKQAIVFADKLIHASMIAGCMAADIKLVRFAHNDMAHLETLLKKHQDDDAPKFILSESVFSMDGDIAPLVEIYDLAERYDAMTIIDEAHATGVQGEKGQGLAQGADVIIGTFGKAFGSFGAYVACSQTVKEYLVNKCGGLIYATALPPSVLGAIEAALDLVPTMKAQRKHLHALAQNFREGLKAIGLNDAGSQTQIVPVILGNAATTLQASESLKQAGYWVTAIRPPTVPPHQSRLRFALNAQHTQEQIDDILQILQRFAQQKAA